VSLKPAGDLSTVGLLRTLDEAAIRSLEQRSTWRRFARGEQILDRDSASRDVFLVVEGCVEVVNYSLAGQEVAFSAVSQGGYFGEMAAIDGKHRSANVVAAENSLLLVVPPELFMTILNENPLAAMEVLRRLSHIVRTVDDRIMDLSTLRAVQRVYVEILRLCETDEVTGRCLVRALPVQRDLARRASTTRETVSRVFAELKRAGIAERKGRVLHIHDKERLEEMVESLTAGDAESLR
jgi:CRP/FNR family cyclic AMP-dependent transcriptional regulator